MTHDTLHAALHEAADRCLSLGLSEAETLDVIKALSHPKHQMVLVVIDYPRLCPWQYRPQWAVCEASLSFAEALRFAKGIE